MEVGVSDFYTDDFGSLVALREEVRQFITEDNLDSILAYSSIEEIEQLFERVKEHVQRFYTLDINVKESAIKLFEQEEIGLSKVIDVIDLEGFIDSVMSDIASGNLKLELVD